jgi:hypothetical protein
MVVDTFHRWVAITIAFAVLGVGLTGCKQSDAGVAGDLAQDAGPTICELLSDGTCSPPGESTGPNCSGCFPSVGHRYDAERDCLDGPETVAFACAPSCAGFGEFNCFTRDVGGSSEAYYAVRYNFIDNPAGIGSCDIELFEKVYGAHGNWCDSDAGPTDAAVEDAAPDTPDATDPSSCELLPDGTCSPPGESTGPNCSGCFPSVGHRYDAERDCLDGPETVAFACAPSCAYFGEFNCFTRDVGGSSEAYYAVSYNFIDKPAGIGSCDIELFEKVYGAHGNWCDSDAGPTDAAVTGVGCGNALTPQRGLDPEGRIADRYSNRTTQVQDRHRPRAAPRFR